MQYFKTISQNVSNSIVNLARVHPQERVCMQLQGGWLTLQSTPSQARRRRVIGISSPLAAINLSFPGVALVQTCSVLNATHASRHDCVDDTALHL